MDYKKFAFLLIGILSFLPLKSRGEEAEFFPTMAPQIETPEQGLRLKSNLLPWLLTVPNLGLEYVINERWSASIDVMYCPWKVTDKYSVKTLAILPEGRVWLKTSRKGSFFNLHLNLAWYNVRANRYRYQDVSRPLLGGGIGYGYRVEINKRWGFEFEIGAGFANTKYSRYYNVDNGALKDNRITTYWGIDRASIAVTYYICDL